MPAGTPWDSVICWKKPISLSWPPTERRLAFLRCVLTWLPDLCKDQYLRHQSLFTTMFKLKRWICISLGFLYLYHIVEANKLPTRRMKAIKLDIPYTEYAYIKFSWIHSMTFHSQVWGYWNCAYPYKNDDLHHGPILWYNCVWLVRFKIIIACSSGPWTKKH